MKKKPGVLKSVVLSVALSVSAVLGLVHVMPEAKPNFEQAREMVVELQLKNDEGYMGFCSGVKISETEVLTAAHCDIGKDIFVNKYKTNIIKKDEKRDLMLLHIPVGSACPCVDFTYVPKPDEKVVIVGFPLDAGKVLTEGTFQNETVDGEVLVTAPATYGNSGGAIFTWRGDHWALVGILTHGTIIPLGGFIPVIIGHLNYGEGANNIFKFLTNHE